MGKNNSKKLALMIVYWCAVIGIVILVIGLTVNCAKLAYQIGYHVFYDIPYQENSTEEIIVTVPEGCTMGVMAKALKQKGVIGDEIVFYLQSMLYGYELVPGEHIIRSSMTGQEILKELGTVEGKEKS